MRPARPGSEGRRGLALQGVARSAPRAPIDVACRATEQPRRAHQAAARCRVPEPAARSGSSCQGSEFPEPGVRRRSGLGLSGARLHPVHHEVSDTFWSPSGRESPFRVACGATIESSVSVRGAARCHDEVSMTRSPMTRSLRPPESGGIIPGCLDGPHAATRSVMMAMRTTGMGPSRRARRRGPLPVGAQSRTGMSTVSPSCATSTVPWNSSRAWASSRPKSVS